jgi:dTDP-glucose 4,6-dehydratase
MSAKANNRNPIRYLVTGGAGFIGTNFVRFLLNENPEATTILNLDKLTYAGNTDNLKDLPGQHPHRYRFVQGDINDHLLISRLLKEFTPDYVVNFAAETHVDRSIDNPGTFIQTNITGTFVLLDRCLEYYRGLQNQRKKSFRLLHVSTDEVYGTLGPEGLFRETTPYRPSSPYSASKAAADHLVSAWHTTYRLPVLITNCSNNYGPYQFPEKLIPLMIIRALNSQSLPIYGRGENIRDWIFVKDHCRGIKTVLEKGKPGRTYNIGSQCEKTNLQVVEDICRKLDRLTPRPGKKSYLDLIRFVPDRPGHDFRYALDITRIRKELKWEPAESFDSGLGETIDWYVRHRDWWEKIRETRYQQQRLGNRS